MVEVKVELKKKFDSERQRGLVFVVGGSGSVLVWQELPGQQEREYLGSVSADHLQVFAAGLLGSLRECAEIAEC